ncbi:site-specific integrase [Mesorhizobium sp. M0514]|uniref:tyrosine-type recombinase/integrase n=1 Tax=Mesorhizobium sp. M0514 TaxID=2956955 RepID=UPI00333A0541
MSVNKRNWTTPKGEEKAAWVVRYSDAAGVRRLKTFRTKKAADSFAAVSAVEIAAGIHVPDAQTVTVAEAGKNWLKACDEAGLERSTIQQYEQHYRIHIAPMIGTEKLTRITVPFVRNFQDRLREAGRSAAMIKRIVVSLGGLIADAQGRGHIIGNAVYDASKRRLNGKARKVERRQKVKLRVGKDIPTNPEIRAILEHVTGRYKPLLVTAIFTGLRASELRGLRWDHVDLAKALLHVHQRADKFHSIGATKTEAGQRTIPLPPMAVNVLREWKLACPKGDLNLVFPNGEGNIEWHANIIKRGLWPAQVAAGVRIDSGKRDSDGAAIMVAKYPGLHSIRHWYASWLINRRVDGGLELPMKTVQERLGHGSIAMTADVYSHLFPSTDDAQALSAAQNQLMIAVGAT